MLRGFGHSSSCISAPNPWPALLLGQGWAAAASSGGRRSCGKPRVAERGCPRGMCCSLIPDANPTSTGWQSWEMLQGQGKAQGSGNIPWLSLPWGLLRGTWKSWNLGKAGALGCAESRAELFSTHRVALGRNTPSCRGCKRQLPVCSISPGSKLSLKFLPCSDHPFLVPMRFLYCMVSSYSILRFPSPIYFYRAFQIFLGFYIRNYSKRRNVSVFENVDRGKSELGVFSVQQLVKQFMRLHFSYSLSVP